MTNHNPCLQEAHSLVDGAGLRRIKRNIIRPIHSLVYLLNTYYLYRKGEEWNEEAWRGIWLECIRESVKWEVFAVLGVECSLGQTSAWLWHTFSNASCMLSTFLTLPIKFNTMSISLSENQRQWRTYTRRMKWSKLGISDKTEARTSNVHSEDNLRGLPGGVPELPWHPLRF